MRAHVGAGPFFLGDGGRASSLSSSGFLPTPAPIWPPAELSFPSCLRLSDKHSILYKFCISEGSHLDLYSTLDNLYSFMLVSGLRCHQGLFFPLEFSISLKENTAKIDNTSRMFAFLSFHSQAVILYNYRMLASERLPWLFKLIHFTLKIKNDAQIRGRDFPSPHNSYYLG